MTISFLAFACLTVTGCGLYRLAHRQLSWATNPCIEIGTGFFIAMGLVVLWLGSDLVPLTLASQLLVALSVVSSLIVIKAFRLPPLSAWPSVATKALTPSWQLGLVLLIGLYLLIVLINNLNRDIFPWDAFTTWMYRAKAWVVSNQAVDFRPLLPWLAGDDPGYPLAAAHYPLSISAVAALGPALTGAWDPSLSSIPWFFAMTACVLLMVGLCKVQNPHQAGAALAGGAMLATIPIVHLHGMLAGYADIWMMGTSGMGLAAVCVSIQRRESGALAAGMLLLALGCLWKSEGWLWLGMGITVAMLDRLWGRYRFRAVPWLLATLAALWLLQPLNLGPLGIWGASAGEINLGPLGDYAIRPYNPLKNYLEMTLWHGNFLLIIPLYLCALWLLAMRARYEFSGYLLMGLGIVVTQSVIFGVSSYSYYAESGTAINRLLLQMLPVFVVTITALLPSAPSTEGDSDAAHGRHSRSSLYGVALALLAVAAAFPLTVMLQSATTSDSGQSDRWVTYDPADFVPVIGELTDRPAGRQFADLNVPIGVAAAPIKDAGTIQPRYVLTESRMATADSIAFYWISSESPDVHSVSLDVSGASVLDMAEYDAFWQTPIKEMGYLVRPEHFQSTTLGTLSLSSSLYNGLSHLKNHWLTPAPLGQRLINATVGHVSAPITLQGLLSVAFFLVCLIALVRRAMPTQIMTAQPPSLFAAVATLWLMGTVGHLNQSMSLTKILFASGGSEAAGVYDESATLQKLATAIKASFTETEDAVLTLGIDAQGRLQAHRFPFMLLPARAVAVDEAQLANTAAALLKSVVVFGDNDEQLTATADRLERDIGLKLISRGIGYVILSQEGQ